MISIIIPTIKNDLYTLDLLEDIKQKVALEHEVIVLDGPEGVNKKWNKGAEMAKGDILWILNNDIVLTQGLDDILVGLLSSYKISCPLTTRGKYKFNVPVFKKPDNIAGWCFMLRKNDWKPIDKRLDIWYGDDWVYRMNERSVGYGGLVHHYESKTITNPEIAKEIKNRIENDKLVWTTIVKEHSEWSNILLSILIPSVPSRHDSLGKILTKLHKQETDEVEIIVLTDNKKISLGEKRNRMVSLAQGKYIAQIDDDDDISDDYINELLEAIKHNSDIVCFQVECTVNDGKPMRVVYGKDMDNKNHPDHYERKPNHLMCYKKSALKAKWRDITYGEDFYFGNDIVQYLKTESRISKTLYYYNYSEKNTECPKTGTDICYA